ncbi:MAG: hypothetical protein CHACPFDD_02912 [Phycisphaerae bacterium]|nr:hypothetical protein [Phycisphaerae bacterium]
MNKPMLGLLLGTVLGLIDGISAPWGLNDPELWDGLLGIVIGSTFKGLVAGILIGAVARVSDSIPITVVFGILVSSAFAFLVAYLNGKYYLRITLPGAILGAMVGYVTQKYGLGPRRRAA